MAEYWSPKFGHDPVAEALWVWSLDSSQDDTCGTVDDIGWHVLFHVTHGEGVELAEGSWAYVPAGDYILWENDQGFVGYERYERPSGDALMAWHGVQQALERFDEINELEEQYEL
jgi:hypothetical protein